MCCPSIWPQRLVRAARTFPSESSIRLSRCTFARILHSGAASPVSLSRARENVGWPPFTGSCRRAMHYCKTVHSAEIASPTCERLQGAGDCRLAALHGTVQARDADVLLARALLALHQPRRPLHAHDQVACTHAAHE